MNNQKAIKNWIYIAVLVLLVLAVKQYLLPFAQQGTVVEKTENVPFNREIKPLVYTKHARCRMDCRRIDEDEVKDILANGTINYGKSEPNGKPDPKYALEGRTRDNQLVRIVFAPTPKGMVVITCIDLETDYTCHCK